MIQEKFGEKHSKHSQGEDSRSQLSQNVLAKPPNYNLNLVHPSNQGSINSNNSMRISNKNFAINIITKKFGQTVWTCGYTNPNHSKTIS